MWLDVIAFYTSYILMEMWGLMLLHYVLAHVLWAVYFRYQGMYHWYLALLPFKLQFMKMELCYESKLLPVLYTVFCVICSLYFPLWLIPNIVVKVINCKFFSGMCTEVSPKILTAIPFAGKFYMLMEVMKNARDESE